MESMCLTWPRNFVCACRSAVSVMCAGIRVSPPEHSPSHFFVHFGSRLSEIFSPTLWRVCASFGPGISSVHVEVQCLSCVLVSGSHHLSPLVAIFLGRFVSRLSEMFSPTLWKVYVSFGPGNLSAHVEVWCLSCVLVSGSHHLSPLLAIFFGRFVSRLSDHIT